MRRPLARSLTALVAAALLLPAVAACDTEPAGLVIYSGRNEGLVGPLIEKLEDKLGTNVDVRYGDSAELAAQILEEGDKTEAGLFLSQDAGALGALSKESRLVALPQAVLDKVAPAHRGSGGDWVGVSGRVRVLAYNPDKVAKAPDTVHDLVKPEWKGKIAYAPTNASFQAFVTGMRVLEGDDATRTWLKGLKANAKAYESNLDVLKSVDEGETSVGLLNHYYWFEKVAEEGEDKVKAKIHFLPGGDPGALVNVAGVGKLKGSSKSESAYAQKAVDFLLSAEAQKYFNDETKEYPLAAGVKSTVEGLPPLESLQAPKIDLGKLDSLKQTLAMLQDVGMV
ncbi:iron ABC transporter substrate-binding protein [Streptomyces sp. NPDC006208]|uniref:iron ABC transporter substrate-binding protein n=1 Tax=Streptomyces sp. NPDC006208 TaxID=3156734 RepID=UPI0033AC0C7A